MSQRRIAIAHIVMGGVILVGMTALFVFPGIIANLLDYIMISMPDISWTNPLTLFVWIFVGILNVLIFLAVLWLVVLGPIIAVGLALLLGLPSFIGGFAFLAGKPWSSRLLRFTAYPYMIIIPLGTILGIQTLRYIHR